MIPTNPTVVVAKEIFLNNSDLELSNVLAKVLAPWKKIQSPIQK